MCVCNRNKSNPSYVFGSSIITIIIGALAFITALAWNSYVQESFKRHSNFTEELNAKLSYSFIVTGISIIIAFLLLYYIDGDKL